MEDQAIRSMQEIKMFLWLVDQDPGRPGFYVKPNLMQMHSSYCVTDPKGTIVLECGKNAGR